MNPGFASSIFKWVSSIKHFLKIFQNLWPISTHENKDGIGTKLNQCMGFRYQFSVPVWTYDPMTKNWSTFNFFDPVVWIIQDGKSQSDPIQCLFPWVETAGLKPTFKCSIGFGYTREVSSAIFWQNIWNYHKHFCEITADILILSWHIIVSL